MPAAQANANRMCLLVYVLSPYIHSSASIMYQHTLYCMLLCPRELSSHSYYCLLL